MGTDTPMCPAGTMPQPCAQRRAAALSGVCEKYEPKTVTLEQAVAELEEARRLAEAAAGRPEMYALPFECAFLAGQIKGIKSALSIFRRVVPEDTRLRAMADDQKEAANAEANEA